MAGLIDQLGNTVLILGAGASKPFGYPVGSELHRSLESPHIQRDEFLATLGYADNESYRRIVRGFQAASIDQFLATYSEYAERAKLEIAYHLIKEENEFTLINQHAADHWYKYLHDDVLGNDAHLGRGKLSVITFNYDLSLERYLCEINSLRHKLTPEQTRERLAMLPIVHVHGHIGALDVVHGKGRKYGEISPELLKEAASRMVTIHEAQTAKYWERAHGLLAQANYVLFLGFGYGKENLERLALDSNCPGAKFYLAPMNCSHAHKSVKALVPEGQVVTRKDVEAPAPTLERAKWLFSTPTKPAPQIRSIELGPRRRN